MIGRQAALAGILMVLPLLLIAARRQHFASLGPFADAWWVPVFLLPVGLFLALDAIAHLVRAFRRSARALDHGYQLSTVLLVLADGRRDMGFLLSGGRYFSLMAEGERRAVAAGRVVGWLLLAAGGLWMVFGVTLGLYSAARGRLSPTELQLLTLVPAIVAFALAGMILGTEALRVRRTRRAWFRRPGAEEQAAEEIRAWQLENPQAKVGPAVPSGLAAALSVAVVVLAIPVVLAVVTLASASAIAPILTTIAMPSVDPYRQRIARIEAYRSYAVDGDVSVTPAEAGEHLHALLFVGRSLDEAGGQRPPSRTYERPWFPEGSGDPSPVEIPAFAWGDSLVEKAGLGFDEEGMRFLRQIAGHPASTEFSRLARATALDAGQARWLVPFGPGTTMATVPTPNFQSLRDAANVHIGSAALALAEGRPEEAETRIREVIAVGFLLLDQGPTLIDNLVGVAIAESGGEALLDLFRADGRRSDAAELSRLLQVADRTAAMLPSARSRSVEAYVRALPDLVLDSTTVRGLRWEYFINLSTIAPCLNVHRMVFGPDEEYAAFVEAAREGLVRWPSDEALFELARYGWVGAGDPGSETLLSRIASLSMSSGRDSCGRLLRDMGTSGPL